MRADVPLDGASDHGVSEALYLRDPDDNGVELYWDHAAAGLVDFDELGYCRIDDC